MRYRALCATNGVQSAFAHCLQPSPRCAQVLTEFQVCSLSESLNMLNRRSVLATGALAAIPLAAPVGAWRKTAKDAVVLAMTLEPPGLDPTAGAAPAIAEIVQYNILKRSPRSTLTAGLAPAGRELGRSSPDLKTHTFKLRKGVTFQNGEPFNAAVAVKFSYDRAGGEKSTNKGTSAPLPTCPRRWWTNTPWWC